MFQNKRESFCWAKRAVVTALVLALGVLIFCGYAASSPKPGGALPAVPTKDKDNEFTQVYSHTYDEVFQACQETIERMGLFVTDKNKDKGAISGNGQYLYQATGYRFKATFNILIESVNTKPEARVTINAKSGGGLKGDIGKYLKLQFLSELQKILATYR